MKILELAKMSEEEQLLEELGSSWECLHTIYDLSSKAQEATETDDLLRAILQKTSSLNSGVKTALWLMKNGVLELEAAFPSDSEHTKPSDEWVTAALDGGEAILVHPSRQDSAERVSGQSARSALIPVFSRGKASGFLCVSTQEEPFFWVDSKVLRFLQTLAAQASLLIENERLHLEWVRSRSLEQELVIASKIQQSLLTTKPPLGLASIKLNAFSLPSKQVGGDFFHFSKNNSHCLDLLIGDVMGKGVPAALAGAAIKNQFQSAFNQLVANEGRLPGCVRIVETVHREVSPRLEDLDSFATACYARLNTKAMRIELVNCGHTRTLHFSVKSGVSRFVGGSNLPLGVHPDAVYRSESLDFEDGDWFLFYSDGVTEARNDRDELFGEERLAAVLRENHKVSPAVLSERVCLAVQSFSGRADFGDDFTFIAVRIALEPQTQLRAREEIFLDNDLKELEKARTLIERLSRFDGGLWPEETTHYLKLGITEVLSNVIRHGSSDNSKSIVIKAEVQGEEVKFRIYHWGRAFEAPPQSPKPTLSGDGGLGLFLIEKVFNDITYSRDEYGRNCVRLRKEIT
jgi:sigma-B regulation protein RsbU (phosphoserine phosphatase)